MSSANGDSFNFSFPVWMPFVYFSLLIALARISSAVLNRSDENGHPCVFPDRRGKAFSFLPLLMILSLGLSYRAFILRYVPSILTLLRIFIINRCWSLSNGFSESLDDHMIFTLNFVNVVYHIDWFADVEPSLHPWNKSHLIMMYDPFNVLFDLVCYYFVEDFYICVHQGYWLVFFFSCSLFVWFLYQDNLGFIQWVWKCSLLFNFLEEFKKDWY